MKNHDFQTEGDECAQRWNLSMRGQIEVITKILQIILSKVFCTRSPKWPLGGPKMADRVWKGAYPLIFGHSRQLSLNMFVDPSAPSLRKVDDGEKKKKRKKKENRDFSDH